MKTKIALAIAATLIAQSSFAKDKVTLQESIKLTPESSVHFEVPVGSLTMETYDGDTLELEIEVKEADSDWFNSADLDEVELMIDQRETSVLLEIDMEDIVQKWSVRIPKNVHVNIDLGVGEVEIDGFERSASIDVGVGEVDIDLDSDNYREIELETGVGDVDLRGFKNIDRERNLVNESIRWRGEGEYDIEIEVGVGEINVQD